MVTENETTIMKVKAHKKHHSPHNLLLKSLQFLSSAQSKQHVVSLWWQYPSTETNVFPEQRLLTDLHQSLPENYKMKLKLKQLYGRMCELDFRLPVIETEETDFK